MSATARTIFATAAGLVMAFATVAIVDSLGHAAYPVPEGIDLSNPEALAGYVRGLPVGAFLFVVGAWVAATFVGGTAAARLARERGRLAAGIVGAFVFAGTVANLVAIPHPTWVAVVGLGGIALAAWVAGRWLALPGPSA